MIMHHNKYEGLGIKMIISTEKNNARLVTVHVTRSSLVAINDYYNSEGNVSLCM